MALTTDLFTYHSYDMLKVLVINTCGGLFVGNRIWVLSRFGLDCQFIFHTVIVLFISITWVPFTYFRVKKQTKLLDYPNNTLTPWSLKNPVSPNDYALCMTFLEGIWTCLSSKMFFRSYICMPSTSRQQNVRKKGHILRKK